MKKKKVILTVTNDLNYDQRMHRICKSLFDAGYDVLLVGRQRKHSMPLSLADFNQKRLKCIFNRGSLFYLEFNLRLILLLVKHKLDIICSVDLDTLPAGWIASRIKGKSIVYDAHEYFPGSPELQERSFKKWLWLKAEAFLVPRLDSAYTVSSSIADLFETKYSKHFDVIRNVPRLTETTPISSEAPYMIYQGALNAGRGLEELFMVMPGIDMDLWLAGEGDLSGPLRELAQKTAPEKIKFLGRVEPDQLREITASATLGFNLLQPMGVSYQFSLANKFFDYIMAEIPQICIGFQEYRMVNESYEVALLVNDLSLNSLTSATSELIGNSQLRDRLKANCRRAKQHFNWESEEQKLIQIYEGLEG